MAKDTPKWLKNCVIYEVFTRNFANAGTFNDVYNDLERIKALGVDIVWLMPFYPVGKVGRKGTHGSPYSIKNYEEISLEYGNKDFFKKLIDKAHSIDLKIMIDIVFNHTSMDSYLIEKHPEWFLKDEKGNFTRKVSEWNDVYDLDFNNKELWEYLISVLEMWVELGVDGFRCDVASLIPLDFWRRAKEYISQKKELIWLAESLDLNFLNSLRNRGFEVSCDAELYDVFDLTYDYDGYEYLHSFFRGEKGLDYFLNQIYLQKTMLPNNSVKMRFLENHDNPRISFLLNGKNKIKNWTMFYSLLPGATLVYAGQELMLDKLPSLFDKDPIKWNKGDYEFLNYFKKVIKLSKEIKSQCDLFTVRELAKGIIELKWKGESSEYLAILNLEDRFGEIPVDFTLYASDLLTNEIVKIEKIFKIRKLPLIFKLK